MSYNQLLYSNTASDSESYKNLGLNSLYVKSLTVNGSPLTFKKSDLTIQVNTYDGANNLVTADAFSVNVHAIIVGHIVMITIGAITYTAPGAFNYFGIQLPSDFHPNTFNSGLLLHAIGSTFSENKYGVITGGQIRISKDLNSSNFSSGEVFTAPQQTITYCNDN